jgi:fatty acid desaturase
VLSRDADFAEEPGFVPSERTIPRQILTAEALATLNQRSNLSGFLQLSGHLTILGISGSLWVMNSGAISAGNGWIAFPALVIYGFSLAAMFAPLHECVHRTAFASNRWNDLVAWFAGLLSFYNSTFYRRYHKWHHRYTQIPEKDPELSDPKPENWQEYLLELTGLFWWVGKVRGHLSLAFGKVQEYSFLPESAYAEVIRSIRLQLLVYAAAIVLSISLGHPWAILLYWILPMAIGQPILRFVLLAEHMGCTQDDNPLTNTRTTLTLAPLRFLMWNMPFHGEHHLYPSIPFHALPSAHEHLRTHIAQVIPGYMAVHRGLVAKWDRLKT